VNRTNTNDDWYRFIKPQNKRLAGIGVTEKLKIGIK